MWVISIPSNIIFRMFAQTEVMFALARILKHCMLSMEITSFFQRTYLCILRIHNFKNGIILAKFKPLWFMSMLHNYNYTYFPQNLML